jgi:hypothetical protein
VLRPDEVIETRVMAVSMDTAIDDLLFASLSAFNDV